MIGWPFAGRRERLRRQACDWVARLNGPNGVHARTAFERWYRASPDHAEAYDRVAALFEVAGRVRPARRALVQRPARSRWRTVRYAAAASVAAAAAAMAFFVGGPTMVPPSEERTRQATFAAGTGESRALVLSDGSQVLLSPGARLDARIGPDERRLRLLRGEGRFAVAHDARPFIVAAGATEVVARGTKFTVRLHGKATVVSLIEGRIDVSYPASSARPGSRRLASLEPGQRLVVPSAAEQSSSPTMWPHDASRPGEMMIEFDDVPLAQAVEQVNRQARRQVRLADPGLANLRVTGAFRAGDADGFAQGIAAAFGLELEHASDGSPRLRRRPVRAAD